MVSGKCPHPWNKSKKGTFSDGHKNFNKELKGCFEKGKLKYPEIIEINSKLGKERYEKKEHPFYLRNKYAQEHAIKDRWYELGKAKWKELSKEVLIRDNFKCLYCNKSVILGYNCHHKIPWEISHDNSKSNLATACPSCHMKEEAKFRNPKKPQN